MSRSHTNCQDWGYDGHQNRNLVTTRCHAITRKLQDNADKYIKYGHDTRQAHKFMFWGLTPKSCQCITGNYRGDKHCISLLNCDVRVGADDRVGYPPSLVLGAMCNLEQRCSKLIELHNTWKITEGINQSPTRRLLKFVKILADILQSFLTIHPYMDGNGHTGRLLIYTMMVREGYTPKSWDIDAKQPYSPALSSHRDGKPEALEMFLLKTIIG
jgi:Fic/DOC family